MKKKNPAKTLIYTTYKIIEMIPYLRGLREQMTPLLQVSQWEDNAKLTANEFVSAGDYLISNDPTWKWATSTDNDKAYEVDYLPSSKQYLYNESLNRSIIDSNSEFNNQWCLTESEEVIGNKKSIDEWELIITSKMKNEGNSINNKKSTEEESNNFILGIVYDRYYRCPRMFIETKNNTDTVNQASNINHIIESLQPPKEYVNETMTVESHPFHNRLVIAVHPCLSSDAMKHVINKMKEKPKVHIALVLFLKCLSNIFPSFVLL